VPEILADWRNLQLCIGINAKFITNTKLPIGPTFHLSVSALAFLMMSTRCAKGFDQPAHIYSQVNC
jgi:hypothetical protein